MSPLTPPSLANAGWGWFFFAMTTFRSHLGAESPPLPPLARKRKLRVISPLQHIWHSHRRYHLSATETAAPAVGTTAAASVAVIRWPLPLPRCKREDLSRYFYTVVSSR